MIKIENTNEKSIDKILKFLYKDEVMNVLTIHYFENMRSELGDIFIHEVNDEIKALLHIKDDGNSHFTTFYVESEIHLEVIANTISSLNYEDLLLAGNNEEVNLILKILEKDIRLDLFTYYIYDKEYKMSNYDETFSFKKATTSDFELVKTYVVNFFEAENEEAKERISSKINLEKIRLLYKADIPVGFASFFGYSKNFIDISSVYISKEHRTFGYSNILMRFMIDEAMKIEKTPLLQADKNNIVANKLYSSIGYKKISDYTFCFVNQKKRL